MDHPPPVRKMSVHVGAVVLGALIAAGLVAARIDWRAERGDDLPRAFQYDLKPVSVDPTLIRGRGVLEIPVSGRPAHAVAVGPGDRVYVAAGRAVEVFDSSGQGREPIALEHEARALAVAGDHHQHPGRMYVSLGTHVEVYEGAKRLAVWPQPGPRATITSLAVGEKEVYAADAGLRAVLRYDPSGKLLGQIGKRDASRNIHGFVIPSPYFDVALSADGLVRVANPGLHRIQGFTTDGHLEQEWGQRGLSMEGFCGCCNPANFAILPDGRFVTVEKGLPRVKVYQPDGQFECVVAGPEAFAPTLTSLEETRADHKLPVLDVAADSRGRILVLDPAAAKVRVFELEDARTGNPNPEKGDAGHG